MKHLQSKGSAERTIFLVLQHAEELSRHGASSFEETFRSEEEVDCA